MSWLYMRWGLNSQPAQAWERIVLQIPASEQSSNFADVSTRCSSLLQSKSENFWAKVKNIRPEEDQSVCSKCQQGSNKYCLIIDPVALPVEVCPSFAGVARGATFSCSKVVGCEIIVIRYVSGNCITLYNCYGHRSSVVMHTSVVDFTYVYYTYNVIWYTAGPTPVGILYWSLYWLYQDNMSPVSSSVPCHACSLLNWGWCICITSINHCLHHSCTVLKDKINFMQAHCNCLFIFSIIYHHIYHASAIIL